MTSHWASKGQTYICLRFQAIHGPLTLAYLSWEQTASDRTKWRAAVHDGAHQYESDRKATAEKRRQDRKNNALKPPTPVISPCPTAAELSKHGLGLSVISALTDDDLSLPPG